MSWIPEWPRLMSISLASSPGALWTANVLIFALWYWELDRGGPVARGLNAKVQPDFLFPQMTDERWAPAGAGWPAGAWPPPGLPAGAWAVPGSGWAAGWPPAGLAAA